MKRLVITVVCAAALGMPGESGAVGPAPSPCLAGYYCATVTVDITKALSSSPYSPGSGRMTSEPPGLDCTANRGVQSGVCTYTFSWRSSSGSDTLDIVVKATAAGDSSTFPYVPPFSLGNTYTREVTIRSYYVVPELVNYIGFNLARWPVKVTKTGAGTGRVTSQSGIDCGAICEAALDHEKKVTLTAKPDEGAVFKTWTGACNGQGATCTLTVTKATSTNAVFDVKPRPTTPTPTPAPTPAPTPGADKSVDASVLAARAGRSRLGVRVVEVELAANEDLAVALTLARKGKKLALKRFARVEEGRRVLTLVLPKTLRSGLATLQIAADDTAGNRKGWRRTVLVPSRAKVVRSIAAALAPAPPLDPCSSASCATIAVAAGGNGSGRITSEPAGIDCVFTASVSSGTCEYRFVWPTSAGGLHVTLRVQPATGSVGVTPGGTSEWKWAAVAYRVSPGATILFDREHFVLRKLPVSVTKSGAGTGRVVSATGIDCGSTCTTTVNYGTQVTFTTKPDAGAVFKTWTGPCNGQGATCTLTVKQAVATNAVFDIKQTETPKTTTTTAADTSVDASVLAARAGKSRLGARVVEVELAADEDLAVALSLSRKGKKIAFKRFARVKEGRRVLTLVLPKTLRKGIATLGIAADDPAGNRRGWRRTVHVPSLNARHRTLARLIAQHPVAPAPSPCLAGTYCAAITLDLTKLAKTTGGPGSGQVTSEPAGLDCAVKRGVQSGVCTYTFSWPVSSGSDRLEVDFTATPAADSWVGTGSVYAVGITVKARIMVENAHPVQVNSITFNLPARHVSVTKTGAGGGHVSGPNGIDCGAVCETWVLDGAKVSLTAKPDDGAVFKTWTGACHGQGSTCTRTATEAISTNAVFDVAAPPTTPPARPADTSVAASVLAARAGKSRLGVRIVEVHLAANEDLAVALTLLRKGKRVALKEFARVKKGQRVLILVPPKTLRQGAATLRIGANDAAGNRRVWSRSVRLPSANPRYKRSLAALAAAPTPCRARVTVAGHTWALSTTNGFPCAAAAPVVRKLAAKTAPRPVGRYLGTYAGLVCVGRLPGKRPSLIICGIRSRGFTAVRG